MAARLPTFADLGLRDPRAVTPGVTFPASDPAAEAMGRVGTGLQQAGVVAARIGEEQEDKRQQMNEATASIDFLNRFIPIHTKIETSTDPEEIAEARKQYQTMLQMSGGAIDDPVRQKRWMASHVRTVLAANADADKRVYTIQRERGKASLLEQFDTTTRNISGIPESLSAGLLAIDGAIDAGVQSGNFDPVEGYKLKRTLRDKSVRSAAETLITQGRPDQAVALLDRHREDVDPVHADVIRRRAEARGTEITGDAAADWAMGRGPRPGQGGGRGHINYGNTGALGNPTSPGWEQENITTVKSPAGASFRVHKQAAADFDGFLKELEDKGYKIDQAQSGGHNVRQMRGGTSLSEHSFGTAIDINWNKNLFSPEGKKVTDLPEDVGALAEKYNLIWGGNWKSPVDTMHFQWRGPRGGGETRVAQAGAPTMTDAAQSNRSGLPSLADAFDRIDSLNIPPEAKTRAKQRYSTEYNAREADAARSARLQDAYEKQVVEQRSNDIYADVYSGNPQITAQQIATDPAFNSAPERRRQMIELVNNPPGTGVPAARSHTAALGLIERIRLPEGDPSKITDVGQIYDEMKNLNRSDFEFVRKEFDHIRTPGGEIFARRKADFIKAIGAQIDKSNPMMGQIDQSGKAQLYSFEWSLDQKIEEYRKVGKNPTDLLDPSKPDYMGKSETIAPYQKTLQQSLRDQANSLTGGTPTRGTAVENFGAPVATAPIPPAAPAVPPRQPGESPADYLKRTGAGGMPVQ